ncbi:MAG: hypothetical protein ACREIA_04910 [Opitutaceae bacterium]
METPGDPRPPRIPGFADLVALCRELNARGARYIVIGGLAMAHQGFVRATEDVDLLIERSRDNQRKVRDALECLPDKAVRELADDDLDNFVVVRVADEIIVDLMLSACAVSYADAEPGIESAEIDEVRIPFASKKLLWRLKQSWREKDRLDRQWLEKELGGPPA